jgi:hypothetical protein
MILLQGEPVHGVITLIMLTPSVYMQEHLLLMSITALCEPWESIPIKRRECLTELLPIQSVIACRHPMY